MDRKELKAKAKEFAFNNKWNLWKPMLVIFAVSFVAGLIAGLFGLEEGSTAYNCFNLILELVVLPLGFGVTWYQMNVIRGK